MRLKGAKQVHYDSGPNMTPLVDVVMVILIFLMLAGSFGTSEHFMASSMPFRQKGAGGAPPPPGWTPPTIIDVQVSASGDASILGMMSHEQNPDVVEKALAQRYATLQAKGTSPDNIEVVLHPSPGTKWNSLAPLYSSALQANLKKISFAQTP